MFGGFQDAFWISTSQGVDGMSAWKENPRQTQDMLGIVSFVWHGNAWVSQMSQRRQVGRGKFGHVCLKCFPCNLDSQEWQKMNGQMDGWRHWGLNLHLNFPFFTSTYQNIKTNCSILSMYSSCPQKISDLSGLRDRSSRDSRFLGPVCCWVGTS